MRNFPPTLTTDAGGIPIDNQPDTRSPSRFLFWLAGRQRGLLLVGGVLSTAETLPLIVGPWLLGEAVDALHRGAPGEVVPWMGWLVAAIAIAAVATVFEHRLLVRNWLVSMYATMQLVFRRVNALGHVLPRRVPTGEVLSVASTDSNTFGALMATLSRAILAIIAFVVVSIIMAATSWPLALLVIAATPLLLMTALPVLRPMRTAQEKERSRASDLTSMVTDIVAGLRILRGIGGERTFQTNYVNQSRRVRSAAITAATWLAVVLALSAFLSGVLLLLVAWIGAHQVLDGTLSVGQLVTFFGYALFLIIPMEIIFEAAQNWVRGLVAARKTIGILTQFSPWRDPEHPREWRLGSTLIDAASGLVIEPGLFTVIASTTPDETVALADRLGRYLPADAEPVGADDIDADSAAARKQARRERAERRRRHSARDEQRAREPWQVTADGIDLSEFRLADVRTNIVVSDTASLVFSGTLQELVDPHGHLSRQQAEAALHAAAAEDVFELIPGGWQGVVDERGRGLSGGQRQRLVLARALGMDPDVLVLVEPTSAVDAHTEALIADRLVAHRSGSTTVVTTVSPLLLRVADRVVHIVDGTVAAVGTHAELLADDTYRRSFLRDLEASDV